MKNVTRFPRLLALPSASIVILAITALFLTAGPAAAQDLNLSINANKSPARLGASVTYTVHVSNSGTSDVTGAKVETTLPGGTNRFNDSETSDPAGVSCPGAHRDGGETLNKTVRLFSAGCEIPIPGSALK